MGLVTHLKVMIGTPGICITFNSNINSVKILCLSILLTTGDLISIQPVLTHYL